MIFMVSGCSNDPDEIEIREDGKVRVNVGVEANNIVEVVTRASSDYSALTANYDGWTMGIYAVGNNTTEQGSATYSYSGSTGSWTSNLWVKPNYTYDFYAYMPQSSEATVSLNQNKLVFLRQSPFAETDLLVSNQIVTKEILPSSTSSTNEANTISLKMNHLLSKLKIQFQLPDGKYDDLRKIEITKVTLGSDIEKSKNYNIICDYSGAMACTFEAAAANASEKASVDFVYAGSGESILGGKALTLSATSPGPTLYDFNSTGDIYIIPDVINNNNMHLKMTITYNVFTKDSDTENYVETRHQVSATNSNLVVYKNNGAVGTIEASKVYTLTVKIVPSYLYVLADDDQSSSIVLQ